MLVVGFLFGCWISENVLAGEGWDFLSVGFFLLLQEISHGCKFEPQLWAKTQNKNSPLVSEENPLFLGTGKCLSTGVLGEGTEIRCVVCHPRRHLHFSHAPLGFLGRDCVNKTVFFFPYPLP